MFCELVWNVYIMTSLYFPLYSYNNKTTTTSCSPLLLCFFLYLFFIVKHQNRCSFHCSSLKYVWYFHIQPFTFFNYSFPLFPSRAITFDVQIPNYSSTIMCEGLFFGWSVGPVHLGWWSVGLHCWANMIWERHFWANGTHRRWKLACIIANVLQAVLS